MAIDVRVPKELQYLLKHNNTKVTLRIGNYLTDEFFQTYTNFKSFGEFIYFSPYTDEELTKDSKLFETPDMDRYIELTTQFSSYAKMFGFAVETKLQNMVEEAIQWVIMFN